MSSCVPERHATENHADLAPSLAGGVFSYGNELVDCGGGAVPASPGRR
jgi:hypothetical protein